MRAEESFLRLDELAASQVAPERSGAVRCAAAEVERDGNPDERDPGDLEPVAEPPTEVPEVVDESSEEREGEPRDADRNREVFGAPRQPVCAKNTDADDRSRGEPGCQHRQ